MGASRRNRSQYLLITLLFTLFGSWIFWYFEIQTFLEEQSLQSTIDIVHVVERKKKADNMTLLMHEIKSLRTRNAKLLQLHTEIRNEKIKLQQDIKLPQNKNYVNNVTDLLLNEIDDLKKMLWDISDSDKYQKIQNNKLTQQVKSLTVHKNNEIKYYFLYGFCSVEKEKNYNKQVIVLMDTIKNYVSNKYKHWIVLSIPIRQFLIETNFSYTHKTLMRFTQSVIPNINIKQDKFQWIFEPHCREFYGDLKTYYDKISLRLPLPLDIYKYYNVSKMNNSSIGYVDDNDRYSHNIRLGLYDHIVNINHHRNINISDTVRVLNVWQNDSYYSFDVKDKKYPLSLRNNRPLLMECSGEAFSAWVIRRKHACFSIDFHIQRTASWPRRGCIVALFIQGIIQRDVIYNKYRRHKSYQDLMNYQRLIMTTSTLQTQTKDIHLDAIIKQKKRFCSFTVKTLFMWGNYLSDALVRHVVHRMISKQYKYCDMLGSYNYRPYHRNLECNQRNPKYMSKSKIYHHLLVECQKEFKFSINMENTATYGYTSEKIYTGLIANTVPIYFGNKDIEKIVNIERIILCDIEDDILVDKRKQFRAFFRDAKDKYGDIHTNQTAYDIMVVIVLDWAEQNYAPYLQQCVDDVIRVDKNDTLFRWKLSQSMIPRNTFADSHYDGTIISEAFIDALKFLQSPLFYTQ